METMRALRFLRAACDRDDHPPTPLKPVELFFFLFAGPDLRRVATF